MPLADAVPTNDPWSVIVPLLVVSVAVSLVLLVAVTRMVRVPRPWNALVISKARGMRVRFGATLVLPVLHWCEPVDLRVRTLTFTAPAAGSGEPVEARFRVRVEPTEEGVLRAARRVGPAGTANPKAIAELLGDRLDGALVHTLAELGPIDSPAPVAAALPAALAGVDLDGFTVDGVTVHAFGNVAEGSAPDRDRAAGDRGLGGQGLG